MRLARLCFFKACRASSTSFGLSSTSRISSGISMFMIRPLRQGEVEGGSPVDLAFHPDASTVAMDDALNDGQPDAGAFVLIRAVQPLEDSEEFVDIGHVETYAVVG